VGFDAIGTRAVDGALRFPVRDPERGPVRVLIVDQSAAAATPEQLAELLQKHAGALSILLGRTPPMPLPLDSWDDVVPRPFSVGQIVDTVRRLVPLGEGHRPLDT
jgi:hypothetical protein